MYDYINGNLGQIGVSLFFILSGASLMYNYSENFSLKKFYKKRWLAIFPMYYIAWLSAVLFYMYRFYSLNPFCVQRAPWTIVLTVLGVDGYLCSIIPNYYLLGEWFLGCIILMYLLFPVIRLLIKMNPILILCLYTLIYILIVQFYSLKFNIEFFLFTRLLEFIFGMVLIECGNKVNKYLAIICLLIVVLFNCLFINIPQMYKTTIMGVSLFIVLMYIGKNLGAKGNIIFRYISKLSYAIFLCHHIVIDQVCTRFENRLFGIIETYVVLIISIVIIFIIANFLWNFNERVTSVLRRCFMKENKI